MYALSNTSANISFGFYVHSAQTWHQLDPECLFEDRSTNITTNLFIIALWDNTVFIDTVVQLIFTFNFSFLSYTRQTAVRTTNHHFILWSCKATSTLKTITIATRQSEEAFCFLGEWQLFYTITWGKLHFRGTFITMDRSIQQNNRF